ncbi:MAG: cytochrome c oxidase cbb3-type subunit [Acidobacteriota bacterium]|nr:cytochrome c oxidase cbb3-type subunit [Acidobacteriota bacterium]
MRAARGVSTWLLPGVLMLSLGGCRREKREFRQAPPSGTVSTISQSDLHPGASASAIPPTENPDEQNAYAVSEGKRLYDAYNCSGCHFHGGGGIGPPLMDEKWIYGADPANVFSTIVEGRPNGMPSFRGKIPDAQVWQLAAYVRSMSGQLRKDVAPTRDDHMYAKPSEQATKKEEPKSSGVPKSAEMPQ